MGAAPAAAAFLDRPGQPGMFGALMDEYARAAEDFCRTVESFDAARFAAERPSSSENTVSPRSIALHVYTCARRYSDYVRRARGLAHDERFTPEPATVYRGAERDGRPIVFEIFSWVDADAPDKAHAHPDVLALWERIGQMVEDRDTGPRFDFPHVERIRGR